MPATSHLRLFSSWIASRTSPSPLISKCGPLSSQAEGSGLFQQLPCQYQQIRTRKRGIEYQPKNIKRKRTHGWIKRMRTKSGIEVVLRRMLKGRKSLTHWGIPVGKPEIIKKRLWFWNVGNGEKALCVVQTGDTGLN